MSKKSDERKALKEELETLYEELAELEETKNDMEMRSADWEERYDEMLDGEGDVEVAGLRFSPSDILKNLDETAYNTGYNDWIDGELRDIGDEIDAKNDEIKDKKYDIANL